MKAPRLPVRALDDVAIIVVMATYLRNLHPECVRMGMVVSTLQELARRVAASYEQHAATQCELIAMIEAADNAADMAAATSAAIAQLPAWITAHHA